ncbi:hypothetical protein ACFSC3_15250 [Sphingomonas floccifaciens]|uniref:DoxX family protein n=1 Tax=Sphingomonas floccifaciens TaxID=1844115 RepID=A0ABW4NGF4_9SPHN
MLTIGGALKIAFGSLFLLQGAGVVRWPASSFMIGNSVWIAGGLVIVIVGAAELIVARRWLTPKAR